MKRFFVSVALMIVAVAAADAQGARAQRTQAQDFNDVYAKTEFAVKFGPKLYYGAVRPVWTDAETFVFQANEPSGEAWYEVKGTARTPITKAAYDEAVKGRGNRYYDPSDESQYAVRKDQVTPSPDSTKVAFIRDNNVWVSDWDSKTAPAAEAPRGRAPWMRSNGLNPNDFKDAVQLTYDGTDNDAYTQVRWSPDGLKIAALRKQVLKERQIILRDSRPSDQVQPRYRYLDYAKPGDILPQAVPVLLDVAAKKAIPLSEPVRMDQYFLELGQWAPDSRWFTFEYNQRGHQRYQLCAVDAVSGKVRVLADENSDTFIYYYDLWRHLMPDGKHMLWISERDDWRHLYCIDTETGRMTQLTKGAWNVREIHEVTDDHILMNVNGLHAAEGEDPYNKHVVRLDLKTLEIKDLTPENANHQVSFGPDHTCFVDNYSRPDLPTTSVLRSAVDGKVLLPIQKEDISAIEKEGFTMPEVFCAKGRDGKTDIWGTIYRPFKFNPRKDYPVVEYIYAGPHDSHVEKDFMNYPPRFFRLLELGFIVVTIDGMGTDNRSKSFQDVAWRNLKDAGFPDRILWMQAAAKKYKYMNLGKVGIYGYSAGGQNTLSALLFHPEFYKVGVALCGCHDNRMDKIWWNEQWMGYPIGPWYSENSNVDNAYRLEGKLLIINGEMDDNVDPSSSLQVVSELVKNNKDFEQYFLPGHTHNLGGDWITKQIYEFFWRNCR